jgi:hypothetical protein
VSRRTPPQKPANLRSWRVIIIRSKRNTCAADQAGAHSDEAIDHENGGRAPMNHMVGLLRRLTEQEIEMMMRVGDFACYGTLALSSCDRLDTVINALLEADRSGLVETEGAACDLACKLLSLRDETVPSAPTLV